VAAPYSVHRKYSYLAVIKNLSILFWIQMLIWVIKKINHLSAGPCLIFLENFSQIHP